MPGWKLKRWQLKVFRLVIVIYYIPGILTQAYMCWALGSGSSNQYLSVILSSVQEGTDLIAFAILLYVFRPRKEWPEFYGLGLQQFMNREGGNVNARGVNREAQQ